MSVPEDRSDSHIAKAEQTPRSPEPAQDLSARNYQREDLAPFWMTIKSRQVFTVLVLIALAGLLYVARDALGPYILAIVFSYMILPFVRRVENLIPADGKLGNSRRPIATLASVVLVVVVTGVLVLLLAQPVVDNVTEFADEFPEYWADMTDSGVVGDWYGDHVPEDAQAWIDTNISQLGQRLLQALGDVLAYLFNITGSLIISVLSFVIVPVFIIYFLIDRPGTEARIRRLLPEPWVDDTIEVLGFTDSIMASYTRGVILSSLIVGVITGLGYLVVGIDIWIALGVIAFVGEIVPILGPWIAFFISFPIVLVTQPDKAIPAAIVFGVIQALEGWFISPKIQGDAIELPASAVLFTMAIGGAVAGPIGIVIALPVAAILRAIVVYIMRRLDGASPSAAAADLFLGTSEVADEATPAIDSI